MAADNTDRLYPEVQQQVILYCAVSNPLCKASMEIVGTDPLPCQNGYGKAGKGDGVGRV